jgi:hypothetical protein
MKSSHILGVGVITRAAARPLRRFKVEQSFQDASTGEDP